MSLGEKIVIFFSGSRISTSTVFGECLRNRACKTAEEKQLTAALSGFFHEIYISVCVRSATIYCRLSAMVENTDLHVCMEDMNLIPSDLQL
jgi:hypothetical protein